MTRHMVCGPHHTTYHNPTTYTSRTVVVFNNCTQFTNGLRVCANLWGWGTLWTQGINNHMAHTQSYGDPDTLGEMSALHVCHVSRAYNSDWCVWCSQWVNHNALLNQPWLCMGWTMCHVGTQCVVSHNTLIWVVTNPHSCYRTMLQMICTTTCVVVRTCNNVHTLSAMLYVEIMAHNPEHMHTHIGL